MHSSLSQHPAFQYSSSNGISTIRISKFLWGISSLSRHFYITSTSQRSVLLQRFEIALHLNNNTLLDETECKERNFWMERKRFSVWGCTKWILTDFVYNVFNSMESKDLSQFHLSDANYLWNMKLQFWLVYYESVAVYCWIFTTNFCAIWVFHVRCGKYVGTAVREGFADWLTC